MLVPSSNVATKLDTNPKSMKKAPQTERLNNPAAESEPNNILKSSDIQKTPHRKKSPVKEARMRQKAAAKLSKSHSYAGEATE